jgi:hypothetical protein
MVLAIVNMSMGVFYGVLESLWFSIWFVYLGLNLALFVGMEIRIWWFNGVDTNDTHSNRRSRTTLPMNQLNDTYDETTFDGYKVAGQLETSKFKSNLTLCEDLNSIAKFNDDQFETNLVDPKQVQSKWQIKADDLKLNKTPKTPPPPYGMTSRNYYVKSTSPKLKTPKPAQLLEFSEAKAGGHQHHHQCSKQLLVDKDDSEHEMYVMQRPPSSPHRNTITPPKPNPRGDHYYQAHGASNTNTNARY